MAKTQVKQTKGQVKEFYKDETGASRDYKEFSRLVRTKKDAKRILGMSKDEARHARYMDEFAKREDLFTKPAKKQKVSKSKKQG